MTLFDGIPRLTRHPSDRYVVPPMTKADRWRVGLYRRLHNVFRRAFRIDPRPCECTGVHPHEDWPR